MIQNILAIFLKFGSTILFIVLELVCFYFLVSFNKSQSSIWANSSNIFVGSIYEKYTDFTSFLNLKEENENLAKENAILLTNLSKRRFKEEKVDSLVAHSYTFIPSLIINNSIMQVNNRITLNKGKKDGVEKGMGVITERGVIGVVVYASDNYSTVNSLLNIQTKVSGLIRRTNTLGDLSWDGKNPSYLQLKSVPQYISVVLGDTITTSGYSTIFPKGQMVGTVRDVRENTKTGYFDIFIKLSIDFASINQVYVVSNPTFLKIHEFEKESLDE